MQHFINCFKKAKILHIYSDFVPQIFGRVVKTAIYVSRKSFWRILLESSIILFGFWGKRLRTICQNCSGKTVEIALHVSRGIHWEFFWKHFKIHEVLRAESKVCAFWVTHFHLVLSELYHEPASWAKQKSVWEDFEQKDTKSLILGILKPAQRKEWFVRNEYSLVFNLRQRISWTLSRRKFPESGFTESKYNAWKIYSDEAFSAWA